MYVPAGKDIVKAERTYGAAQQVAQGFRPASVPARSNQVTAHWYSQISGARLARQAVARGRHALTAVERERRKAAVVAGTPLFWKRRRSCREWANLTYFSYSGISPGQVSGRTREMTSPGGVRLIRICRPPICGTRPSGASERRRFVFERPRSGGSPPAWLRNPRLSIHRWSIQHWPNQRWPNRAGVRDGLAFFPRVNAPLESARRSAVSAARVLQSRRQQGMIPNCVSCTRHWCS